MSYMYNRHGKWRMTVSQKGVRKDIALCKDLEKAKIVKKSIEKVLQETASDQHLVNSLVNLGVIPKVRYKKRPLITWEYAKMKLLEFLKQKGRSERTLYMYNLAFASIEKLYKPERPSDVTAKIADKWVAARRKIRKSEVLPNPMYARLGNEGTIVRTLKSAFQQFCDWQYVDVNPLLKYETPKTYSYIPRPLTFGELNNILRGANKPLQRTIKILCYSGMRLDELLNITWRNVFFTKKPYIEIVGNGKWQPHEYTHRKIPIGVELRTSLGRPPRNRDRSVAGITEIGTELKKNWFTNSFLRAAGRAGIRGLTAARCCRDTYAMKLALQGHSAHEIAELLGIQDHKTVTHYVNFAKDHPDCLNKNPLELNFKDEDTASSLTEQSDNTFAQQQTMC